MTDKVVFFVEDVRKSSFCRDKWCKDVALGISLLSLFAVEANKEVMVAED